MPPAGNRFAKPARLAGRWLLPAIAIAAVVAFFALSLVLLGPGHDAIWYVAAGERLDAGHLLYALSPGDRPIPLEPPLYDSPFLYPPAFALLWAPLAALSSLAGLWLWWATVLVGVAAWLVTQLRRGGARTALAVLLLSFPIGQTLATGNVNGLVVIAFGAGWLWRDRPAAAGMVLGTVTAWKVFPGMIIIWMLATRRWRAAAWALCAAAGWALGAMVLLGPSTTWTYVTQVVPSTQAMGISAAYLFQAPAATYLLLALGVGAVVILRHRTDTSYALAVLTAVLAWPSLGVASLAMLAGLAPVLQFQAASGVGPARRTVVPEAAG
jgi:alpha-1,2-mannosyltransferase